MDEAAETNSLSNNIPTECQTIRRADYGTNTICSIGKRFNIKILHIMCVM